MERIKTNNIEANIRSENLKRSINIFKRSIKTEQPVAEFWESQSQVWHSHERSNHKGFLGFVFVVGMQA